MTDVVDRATRSRMMSGIRNRNTRPEMLLRCAIHARGLRYRLHVPDLPGKPDIVFRSRKAVIFVHGCFWHGHACSLFKWPSTRPEWWHKKIMGNRVRDFVVRKSLETMGWRILVVWECALKRKKSAEINQVIEQVIDWIENQQEDCVIRE